ncbi:TPA: tetratricopeptide repeat protein [Salmonella enterica]
MKFTFRTLIFVGLFYAIAPLAYAETSLDELQQQADRGDMNAQFQLGRKYHIGDGVERDVEKAVFWYQKAAAQGSAKATNNLGVLYEHGHVAPEDEHRSVEWIMEKSFAYFTDAAKKGQCTAQQNIGATYAYRHEYVQAWAWLTVAATRGSKWGLIDRGRFENSMSSDERKQAEKLAKEYLQKYDTKEGRCNEQTIDLSTYKR